MNIPTEGLWLDFNPADQPGEGGSTLGTLVDSGPFGLTLTALSGEPFGPGKKEQDEKGQWYIVPTGLHVARWEITELPARSSLSGTLVVLLGGVNSNGDGGHMEMAKLPLQADEGDILIDAWNTGQAGTTAGHFDRSGNFWFVHAEQGGNTPSIHLVLVSPNLVTAIANCNVVEQQGAAGGIDWNYVAVSATGKVYRWLAYDRRLTEAEITLLRDAAHRFIGADVQACIIPPPLRQWQREDDLAGAHAPRQLAANAPGSQQYSVRDGWMNNYL